jgi:hypothetical protein
LYEKPKKIKTGPEIKKEARASFSLAFYGFVT